MRTVPNFSRSNAVCALENSGGRREFCSRCSMRSRFVVGVSRTDGWGGFIEDSRAIFPSGWMFTDLWSLEMWCCRPKPIELLSRYIFGKWSCLVREMQYVNKPRRLVLLVSSYAFNSGIVVFYLIFLIFVETLVKNYWENGYIGIDGSAPSKLETSSSFLVGMWSILGSQSTGIWGDRSVSISTWHRLGFPRHRNQLFLPLLERFNYWLSAVYSKGFTLRASNLFL